MRLRLVLVTLLLIAMSLSGLATTAQEASDSSTVSIAFNFEDSDDLSSIDTATVTLIEGWTGTVLSSATLADGDSLEVPLNHSVRFSIEAAGYIAWMDVANRYSEAGSLTASMQNTSTEATGITAVETNVSSGLATLSFPEEMGPGITIELGWSAVYAFSSHYGTELMPGSSTGLAAQIDLWLGDDDGVLSGDEKLAFSDWMSTQAWSDATYGGCCELDENDPIPLSPVSPSAVWIAEDDSSWGWNETATLSVNTGFTTPRLLFLPLQNDIRQTAPVRVLLPLEWEFRSSPASDVINGSPSDFEVTRDSTGLSAFLPISLAPNTAPTASGKVQSHIGESLPHLANLTLDGSASSDSSHNAGLGPTLACGWQLISDSLSLSLQGEVAEVNLSASGFSAGEEVETLLTCSDVQGLNDTWNDTWYIDGAAPVAVALSGTLECLDDPGQVDLLLCEELSAPSSTVMSLNLSVSDDGPSDTLAFWSSNHIEGWSSEGTTINVVFWQGQNTNINFLQFGGQHEQRELAVWVFQLRASDEVGNDWVRSWNVTVSDGTAPRINSDLVNSTGSAIDPMQSLRTDMELVLDLNASFDDIHPIEDVHFVVTFDGTVLADSDVTGWEGVRTVALPSLSVGQHDLIINATDGDGNTVEDKIHLLIEPALGIDISEIAVRAVSATEPGLVTLNLSITNSGATPYNATICIAEQCFLLSGDGATFEGEGLLQTELEVTLQAGTELEVNYSFVGDDDQQSFSRIHDIEISAPADSATVLTGVIATGAVFALAAWMYRRR